MIELLAPAGSVESLHAAVNAGADAVYVGGSMFGARAYADNPDQTALLEGIDYCHLHGRKLYMTVNTLLKEKELEEQLYDYLLPYYMEGLDGVIVQDFGVVRLFQECFPEMEIHASTQMTVTGVDGARILKEQGLTRIVPARELSLGEIRKIIDDTGIEVESFIHGAMCYCYSGQCLFSSMLGGRSGNRGRCAQPCRLPYRTEGKNPSCLLSMKDMNTLELLPEILDAGIVSLKIEGRMKRPEYTAGVVSVYRKYIDHCLELGIGKDFRMSDPEYDLNKRRQFYKVSDDDQRILMDLYNRGGFTEGYYHTRNGRQMMSPVRPNHYGTAAAKIRNGKHGIEAAAIEPLYKGDVLELHGKEFELTLGSDVAQGKVFFLPKTSLQPKTGEILYRTRCEALLSEIRSRYSDKNCKEKIKGALMICQDTPAILNLDYQGIKISVTGTRNADEAQSRPIDQAAVRKQMDKTGNTAFVFEDLTLDIRDHVFLPIGELNDLRRRGLESLSEAILDRFRRKEFKKPEAQSDPFCDVQWDEVREASKLYVSVMTEEQLNAVLRENSGIAGIYLDLLPASTGQNKGDHEKIRALSEKIHRSGMECYLNFPPVFRDSDRAFMEILDQEHILNQFDGFLLHTIDELSYMRDRAGKKDVLLTDDTFYAYNRRAAQFLDDCGADRQTYAAELNSRELAWIRNRSRELIVYGRESLMHSAQCVRKNTGKCNGRSELLGLNDRRNTDFPVQCRCISCCNTIYNSVPTDLSGCREEIERLNPQVLRLSFTIENEEETLRILRKWRNGIPEMPADGSTRGHFRRGVE